MKKLALLFAGAAAFVLSACGDADDAAEDSAVLETETTAPAPAVTETTTVVRDIDGDDRITIDEDGVEVDIDDGGTDIEAEIDEDPSVTVRN